MWILFCLICYGLFCLVWFEVWAAFGFNVVARCFYAMRVNRLLCSEAVCLGVFVWVFVLYMVCCMTGSSLFVVV